MSSYVDTQRRSTSRLPWRTRHLTVQTLPGEQRLPFVVTPSPKARRLNRIRISVLALGAMCLGALAIGMLASPNVAATSQRADLSRAQWAMIIGAFTVAALTIRHLVARLREALEQSERLSRTDQLTGVANRWAWDQELDREMARSRRDGSAMTVALVDLDRFDAFNQLRGHPEGDRLLQRMAATWTDVLRDTDTLSRYEGAQFAVLLRQCGMENAVAIIERLRMLVPDDQTVSAGVATWNGQDTAPELMCRAEESLIAAKLGGRDRVRIAGTTPGVFADATKWNAVVQQLLDDRSVVAAYQPVVDLRGGSIVAYEALARPNRDKINISVERMFSSAQRMGLGRDLDWLCRRAALAGATWVPTGIPVFINCNLSGLVDPVHRVDQMLLVMEAAGRDPRDVVLEITERELVGDLSRLKMVVATYRREGFRFAVDDVGEGHSTLEVLAATAPDFIKVARSLVIDAASVGPRAAIRAVVAFAEETGASTIAEGIETESTALYIRELGVHLGQGWLFGRPELPPTGAPQTVLSQIVPNGR